MAAAPTLHLQLVRCSSHVSSKNELCELSHVACPIDEQTDSPWQANLTKINGSAPFEAGRVGWNASTRAQELAEKDPLRIA